ncbi:MAG: zinc finger domain-containing protein [Candidatus Hermodarchaeia archaeon]
MSESKSTFCSCCGGLVTPRENSVQFACPACGNYTIRRCQKCREFANSYTCPACNFQGP